MTKKQLYESIMHNVAKEVLKTLNEVKEEKYTLTYKSKKYMYLYLDDQHNKKSLKDTMVNPKYIKLNNGKDLNVYLLDNYPNIKKLTKNIHISEPYKEDNKLCFDIESDVPFDTEVRGEGWGTTLKDVVFKYLDGQISDGWGENGIGIIKIHGKEHTLFV